MDTSKGEIEQDLLSKGGAQALASKLREVHGWSPFFRVVVLKSSYQPVDGAAYVVRTNLINGMPPTKPTKVEGAYAKDVRLVASDSHQAA